MGSILELWRYPLKSALGERLPCVAVDPDGLRSDRAWACVDPADGTLGSAKHPQRWGRLLEVRARVDASRRRPGATRVQVEVDGSTTVAGSPEADALVSRHLHRPVRLTRVVPAGARVHRLLPTPAGLVPDWMGGVQPGEAVVTDVAGARPGGRFVDYGAIHLLTTAALAELASELGRDQVDAERFRPNLVVDAVRDPDPGQVLRIGDAVLRVLVPTPRCIVPGLTGRADRPIDQELLGTLARHHRQPVGQLGRAACFGVYAEVLRPGRVEVGQLVALAG